MRKTCEHCGSTHLIGSEEAAYNEGFRKGVSWPDQWEGTGLPGGPRIIKDCSVSRIENAAYLTGWNIGHNHKISSGLVGLEPSVYHHSDLIEKVDIPSECSYKKQVVYTRRLRILRTLRDTIAHHEDVIIRLKEEAERLDREMKEDND